jgi:hypothetical protein
MKHSAFEGLVIARYVNTFLQPRIILIMHCIPVLGLDLIPFCSTISSEVPPERRARMSIKNDMRIGWSHSPSLHPLFKLPRRNIRYELFDPRRHLAIGDRTFRWTMHPFVRASAGAGLVAKILHQHALTRPMVLRARDM